MIEVIDVDAAASDSIGSGSCELDGRECQLGQATVTVQRR